jgi:hypothetical protein
MHAIASRGQRSGGQTARRRAANIAISHRFFSGRRSRGTARAVASLAQRARWADALMQAFFASPAASKSTGRRDAAPSPAIRKRTRDHLITA